MRGLAESGRVRRTMKGPSGGSILECNKKDDDEINSFPRVKLRFVAGVRLVQKASFCLRAFAQNCLDQEQNVEN